MQFVVLGSGSRGNCTMIESGDTSILIDCGFSGKEIVRRLASVGKSMENINAVLVTHEHHDHISGVGVISRRFNIPVYLNYNTLKSAEKKIGKVAKITEFETGKEVEVNDLAIHPYAVSHDTSDPVGFVINDGKNIIGYCTDTGKVSKLIEFRLKQCHSLILEFNHDEKMLKNGPYPHHLQQRVRSSHGHLSNKEGAIFLNKLSGERLKHVVLAHLSEVNNTPELAFAAIDSCMTKQYNTNILAASQKQPTPLIKVA